MESPKTPPDPRIASAVWLVVALVFSAISAYLTHMITEVNRDPPQLGIAVYASDGAAPQATASGAPALQATASGSRAEPTVEFVAENDGIDLTFSNLAADPALDRLLFGPVPKALEHEVRCEAGFEEDLGLDGPPLAIDATRIVGTPGETDAVYAELGLPLPEYAPSNPVAGDPLSLLNVKRAYEGNDPNALSFFSIQMSRAAKAGDAISCRIPDVVVHDTFTSRAFRVVVVRAALVPLRLNDPDSVSFTDEDEHDARVSTVNSGVTVLGTTVLAPFPKKPVKARFPTRCVERPVRSVCTPSTKFVSDDVVLEFAWDSITATQHRDIYIVIIGSLIALAAAALIEASRPFIDRFVARFSD
jgi:hypothetical protein